MDNHSFGELDCNSTSVAVPLNSDTGFSDFIIGEKLKRYREQRDATLLEDAALVLDIRYLL